MNSSRLGARRPTRQSYNPTSSSDSKRKHRPDYLLVVYMTLLLGVGAVTVYAISPGITAAQGLNETFFSYKQLTAIALGLVFFLVASSMKVSTWHMLEKPMLVAALIVALVVRFMGDPINGAYRWLDIGGVSFQAAELIKLAIILWLAGFLTRMKVEQKMHSQEALKTLGILAVVTLFIVAGLQSDLGSAAVMLSIIGFMSFVAGLPFKKLLFAGIIALVLVIFAISTSSYRRDRVATFLNPTADCQNEGYQACQALITVGSGGMFGKGLGRSVQAYGYLPEAANDSIFAIIAEKYGFIGASIMVGIFVALFRRIKTVAVSAPDDYSRLLVSGILAWLSVQMMINIGAMVGLIPLKGITLPLVSYGGTSIIFVMVAIGIVFQVSRYTDFAVISDHGPYGTNSKPRTATRVSRGRTWGDA